MKKLFVGNLSFDTTETSLRSAFAAHGTVASAAIVSDRETGRSRGFGFVEMDDSAAADTAIATLNNTELDGRKIVVNEARPKEKSGFGGGNGGGGRQGGGFRNW